jgi:hypothetical protein
MEKHRRRPFVVTLLCYGVFLLGAGYLLKSGQALSHYSLDSRLPLSVPPWYPVLSGGLWGGLWLALAAGLWRGREWARRFTLIALAVQLGVWLADWFLFSRSSIAIQSFWFEFTVRLALSGICAGILLLWGRREAGGKAAAAAGQSGRESTQVHVDRTAG